MSSTVFFDNIEKVTIKNDYYRKVIYTGKMQLVLMHLEPGEFIPEETHEDVDQFIRVEAGKAMIIIDNIEYILKKDDSIIIPAGSKHYVANNSKVVLKLYTIYSKPEHKPGKRQFNQSK